jgi:hypothetical protein
MKTNTRRNEENEHVKKRVKTALTVQSLTVCDYFVDCSWLAEELKQRTEASREKSTQAMNGWTTSSLRGGAPSEVGQATGTLRRALARS